MREGPLAHPDDVHEVNNQAAQHGADDPHERRDQAYHEYRQAKHLEAAAHHLVASDAALRRGEQQAKDRHQLLYGLHRRALGMHREVGVPDAIRARLAGAKIGEHTQGFTPHAADGWVLGAPR